MILMRTCRTFPKITASPIIPRNYGSDWWIVGVGESPEAYLYVIQNNMEPPPNTRQFLPDKSGRAICRP